MSTDISSVTQLRLQLLENGYSPIRNRDKRTFMENWPRAEITPEEIERWGRRHKRDSATGLRIENGLVAVDLDIDHPVINEIINAWLDMFPELEDPSAKLMVRRGKGHKEAWFLRCDELFSRLHTRAWVAPGEEADDRSHRVEIFGGASARQFGAFGPHTVGDDGEVKVWYSWVDLSPADTRLDELLVMPKEKLAAMCDRAEEILQAHGWTPVLLSTKGESEAARAYDLTEDMSFDTNTDERLSLSELRERAGQMDGLRCSASWLEGPTAVNRTRCLVSLTGGGHVAIWESAAGVTHLEKAAEPKDWSIDIDRYREKMAEIDARNRYRVKAGDGAVAAASKLLETYAWCPAYGGTPVVPVWSGSVGEGAMSLTNFRITYLPYCDEQLGPRGGVQKINPVDLWSCDERRYVVEGQQLRPDMPRPMFKDESGRLWLNTYDPVIHAAEGGDASIGIEFMEQLVPDAEERAYFLQWLAFKIRYPHIPGPALVMVAHGRFGTGRGTFAVLLAKLLGTKYVREMPYSIVSGRTYQSQYTDWMADSLVVFVNESSEAEHGQSTYMTKRNTYERLKEIIEPRPLLRTYITRGRKPFQAPCACSFVIATNHRDAIPVAQDDRRFAVVQNGDPREPAYWNRLNKWLEDPANIAAFYDWLMSIDISAYDPFAAPPLFEGKRTMIEEGGSDLDQAFDAVVAALPGEVVTIPQLTVLLNEAKRVYGYEYPDNWLKLVRKVATNRLYRVGVRDGINWQIYEDGRKLAVYARSPEMATKWKLRDHLREEALKNGSLVGTANSNLTVGIFRA